MGVAKDNIADQVVNNKAVEHETKHSIFQWPSHSPIIEHLKTKSSEVSPETQLRLAELELYQEEATTQQMGGRVVEAARAASRHCRRRVWIRFDIFMARGRPGLEVEGLVVEEGRFKKKRRKRTRKSKSDKNKSEKEEGKKESFIYLIQAEDVSSVSRAL